MLPDLADYILMPFITPLIHIIIIMPQQQEAGLGRSCALHMANEARTGHAI